MWEVTGESVAVIYDDGTDAYKQTVNTRIPMRRDGKGEDIAWATAFLCSDQGSWITGQSINIDGGMAVQH
mgnify:CR=1 FL=1